MRWNRRILLCMLLAAMAPASAADLALGRPQAYIAQGTSDPTAFQLILSAPLAYAVTVSYQLTGPAQPGVDYAGPASGVIVIPAGARVVNVPLTALIDPAIAFYTSVTMTVTSATVAPGEPAVPINSSRKTFYLVKPGYTPPPGMLASWDIGGGKTL
jgi:hypothetical protein